MDSAKVFLGCWQCCSQGKMRSQALSFPFPSCFKHKDQRLNWEVLSAVVCHQPASILPQRAPVCRRKAELSLEQLQHARL